MKPRAGRYVVNCRTCALAVIVDDYPAARTQRLTHTHPMHTSAPCDGPVAVGRVPD